MHIYIYICIYIYLDNLKVMHRGLSDDPLQNIARWNHVHSLAMDKNLLISYLSGRVTARAEIVQDIPSQSHRQKWCWWRVWTTSRPCTAGWATIFSKTLQGKTPSISWRWTRFWFFGDVDRLRVGWLNGFSFITGRGAARAEDAQGTPIQSHTSPNILVYKDNMCTWNSMDDICEGHWVVPAHNTIMVKRMDSREAVHEFGGPEAVKSSAIVPDRHKFSTRKSS